MNGQLERFLQALLDDVEETPYGVGRPVVTGNLPFWLLREISQAQSAVLIATERISDTRPTGEQRDWLKVIDDLLRRGVGVTLLLNELPALDPNGYNIARRLQVLIEHGLNLRRAEQRPDWNVLLDPQDEQRGHALQTPAGVLLILDDKAGERGLLSTITAKTIAGAMNAFTGTSSRSVTLEALKPPAHVRPAYHRL